MSLKEYINVIVKFLKDYLKKSHAKGYTLGLSGGVDSALTLALLLKATDKKNIQVVIMPIESNPLDKKYAIEQCKKFNIDYKVIDLTSSYKEVAKNIEKAYKLTPLALSNIKVRLRMVTLYAIAQANNSLVVGTDNLDERYVGYFTKYGDGAADILPIAKLTKGEVFEASKLLGVTSNIINRAPSAGLFNNQKDEDDLQVSYKSLDKYLLKNKVTQSEKSRIEYLHKISEHKRKVIPEAPKWIRKKK